MAAYYDGILDVYYAKMTVEDTSLAAPTYATPAILGKSMEVTITPIYREGKMYASNTKVRDIRKIDGYTVKLGVDKIEHAVLADILGRTADSNGVQVIAGNDVIPNVAIGFACTLDDDTKELWWLYKGTFGEINKSAKTSADKIEYQTPSLEGNFVRRMNDDRLAVVVESGADGIGTGVVSGWFSAVYETPAATPPAQTP